VCGFAQQSLGTIALDRTPDAPGRDHRNTRRAMVIPGSCVHDDEPPATTTSGEDGGDVSGRAEPLGGRRSGDRGHEIRR
jgi:hypothetical protein